MKENAAAAKNGTHGNSGNTMGAEFWEYDARIGRRYNIDPIEYAWQSPYATFDDDPISLADPDGLQAQDGGGAPKKPTRNRGNHSTRRHKTEHKGKPSDPKANGGVFTKENWQKVSAAFDKLGNKAQEALEKFDPKAALYGKTTPLVAPLIPVVATGIEALIEAIFGTAVITTAVKVGTRDRTRDRDQQGDWVVYEIWYDEIDPNGNLLAARQTYKYGISGQEFYKTKEGHPRPEEQISDLNKQEAYAAAADALTSYRRYRYTIIETGLSKLMAEYIEQQCVNLYYAIYKTTPEGNKKPLPDSMRGRRRKKFDTLSPNEVQKVKEFIKKLAR